MKPAADESADNNKRQRREITRRGGDSAGRGARLFIPILIIILCCAGYLGRRFVSKPRQAARTPQPVTQDGAGDAARRRGALPDAPAGEKRPESPASTQPGEANASDTADAGVKATAATLSGAVPVWKLVAVADGAEVEATIMIGGQPWPAPQTFTLEPGRRYRAEFSYESGGRRYTAEPVVVAADWDGLREQRVELFAQTAPVEGRNWISPSTGMEFVWVSAMKMWVGKHEATNGEFREKYPDHDSKDYEGIHSLNGDRQPAVNLRFDEAAAYAKWLSRELPAGYRYRLPSEREWETFAQCGDNREFPWGRNWPPWSGLAGNYDDEGDYNEARVEGEYSDGHLVACNVEESWANPWGLYGVGGNVWEACASDSGGESFGAWRGAAWDISAREYLRCSCRYDDGGDYRFKTGGFRLVLSPVK